MDPTCEPNHSRSRLINALFRVQGRLVNTKWQIEANISVLRSLAEMQASRRFHSLAWDNVDVISGALVQLDYGAARAEFLTRQVHNAIKQVNCLKSESLILS